MKQFPELLLGGGTSVANGEHIQMFDSVVSLVSIITYIPI